MLDEFTTKDLSFMVGRDDNKVSRLIETSKKFQLENPNLSDIDFFNSVTNGRGVEIYNRLSKHRIESKEYINAFAFIKNNKTINVETKEGRDTHIYRNKNQYKKGPKNLKLMWDFVKKGHFVFEGFSPCHNIVNDDRETRKRSINEMVYLISNNLIKKKNKFSIFGNMSFRGSPGSDFEGCQFVYNFDSGTMVTDNRNRGTWDFGKFGTPNHMYLDVVPWVKMGNGENLETIDMFAMSDTGAKKILNSTTDFVAINSELNKSSFIKNVYKNMGNTISNFFKNENVEKTAEEYYRLFEEDKKNIANDFLKYYIDTVATNKLNYCYSKDWKNYVYFCNIVKNRDIINGLVEYINYIDVDPTNYEHKTEYDDEKEYMEKLLKCSIITKNKEYKIAGNTVCNLLPMKIKVVFTPSIISSIEKSFEISSNCGVAKHTYYASTLIHEMNKKIAKYNISLKMDDKLESSQFNNNHFVVKVYQSREITNMEAKLLDEEIIEKYINRFMK